MADPDRPPADATPLPSGATPRSPGQPLGERHVWWLAVAALVADLTTTHHGLARGLVETNPVGVAALDSAGIAGLVAVKAAALGVALACRRALPDRFGLLPPAVLAWVWAGAAGLNAGLILSLG
jgi:hypothetical protein